MSKVKLVSPVVTNETFKKENVYCIIGEMVNKPNHGVLVDCDTGKVHVNHPLHHFKEFKEETWIGEK